MWSCKTDAYKYLTDEEILSSGPSQMIKQAKFPCSSQAKAFGKQMETLEDQGEKQAEAFWSLNINKQLKWIQVLFTKDLLNK